MKLNLGGIARSSLSFFMLFAVWWTATALGWVHRSDLPTPPAVWEALTAAFANGTLWENTQVSLFRLLSTYFIASGFGIVAGVAMGLIPSVGRFFRPLLSFFNSLSGITWLPLAIAWFGIGEMTIAFVIFNSVFFIMAFNTLTGVTSVPRVFEHALLTMGSGRLRVIRDVLIPGALPSIITGLRLAIGFGWRALIAVEMVAGSVGLGYLVFAASYDFRQDKVVMGILLVGLLAMVLDYLLFAPLERWTIERWGLV